MTVLRHRMIFALAACLLANAVLGADNDALVAAARKREEAFPSLVVEFEVKEFTAKGQLSGILPMPGKAAPKLMPKQDTEATSRNKWILKGRMARFENNHPIWSLENGELLRSSSVTMTDGEEGALFLPSGVDGKSDSRGFIWGSVSPEGLCLPFLTPLSTHFRGNARYITPYPFDELSRTGRVATVSGTLCVDYQAQSGHPDKVITFLFDEQNQFLLRRFQLLTKGRLTHQTDVEYRVWNAQQIPSSWKVRTYNPEGTLRSQIDASVLTIEIVADVKDLSFKANFPPGTSVFNQKNSRYYTVQPDGMLREVSITGEPMGAEIPQPGATWFQRNRSWAIPSIFGLLLLALLAVWLRRRSSSVKSQNPT
jgi:hypothetical protein